MRLIILLSLILLAGACSKIEKIENFPIEEPRLVVNSLFTKNEPFHFHVSRSLSVLDNAALTPLSDASIVLYSNNVVIDTLRNGEAGSFYSTITPEYGKAYSLNVSHPRYGAITSDIEELPAALQIGEISATVIDSTTYTWPRYDSDVIDTITYGYIIDCVVILQDPPGQGNVYAISVIKYDSTRFYSSNQEWVKSNVAILSDDHAQINTSRVGYTGVQTSKLYFSDEIFDGQEYGFRFTVDDYGTTTKWREYYLIVYSFSPSSYFYDRSLGESTDISSPFDEPARVFSNMTGGYGIFAGYEKRQLRLK
jgi:hypothetical protein